MEFAGYGLHKSRPSTEAQIIEDLECVIDYVINTLGFANDHIILMGRSIGSGPAVHVAAHLHLGGLVLISPFTSIKCVVKNLPYLGSIAHALVKQRFDNLSKIASINCKGVTIHGDKDDLIPLSQSEQLVGKLSLYDRGLIW